MPATNFTIRLGGLDDPRVIQLLEEHLESMHALSPPESVHALNLDGLHSADLTFWSVWEKEELVGCGALKMLSPEHGEIKSMHTIAQYRGKGVAASLMDHILIVARARTITRLSLETGSMAAFSSAKSLYERFGFSLCAPFGDYKDDPLSIFMTKVLQHQDR